MLNWESYLSFAVFLALFFIAVKMLCAVLLALMLVRRNGAKGKDKNEEKEGMKKANIVFVIVYFLCLCFDRNLS